MLAATPAEALSPALNGSAEFAVNVPSSVLAASGGSGTAEAILANAQHFNFDLVDARYAAVSGTLTATPASAATALAPADYAAFTAATASFDAPAMAATTMTKVIPGAEALPLLSFQVGLFVGSSGARLFGFKDDQVCVQQNPLLTAAAGLLDGVSCDVYNLQLAKIQQNLDRLPIPTTNFSLCDAGVCIVFLKAKVIGTAITYCFGRTGDWNAANRIPLGLSVRHADGTYQSSYNGLSSCPNMTSGTAFEIGDYSGKAASSFYTGWYTLNGQGLYNTQVSMDPEGTPNGQGNLAPENPTRTWVCTITTTSGQAYAGLSPGWSEQDTAAAAVNCPALPSSAVASHVTIVERGPSAGDPSFTEIDSDTSAQYRAWRLAFPECANGSCLLDLRQGSQSCFNQGVDCTGWFADPNRSSTYTCYYGTHTVAISECNIYASLFDSSQLEAGHVYPDPGTGTSVNTPTSPTKEDQVVANMILHGWDAWDPNSDQLLLGPGTGDESAMAHTVARRCIALGVAAQCTNLPIFAPGLDIEEAANHDLTAITGAPDLDDQGVPLTNGAPPQDAELTYLPNGRAIHGDWYRGTDPCKQGTYDGTMFNCDEYPFTSTVQGGTTASIKVIDAGDNRREGNYLDHFYATCGVSSPTSPAEGQFVVVPTPDIPTSVWCNGNAAS